MEDLQTHEEDDAIDEAKEVSEEPKTSIDTKEEGKCDEYSSNCL